MGASKMRFSEELSSTATLACAGFAVVNKSAIWPKGDSAKGAQPGVAVLPKAFRPRLLQCRLAGFAAGIILLAAGAARTQTPDYKNVGGTPTKEQIQAWD